MNTVTCLWAIALSILSFLFVFWFGLHPALLLFDILSITVSIVMIFSSTAQSKHHNKNEILAMSAS